MEALESQSSTVTEVSEQQPFSPEPDMAELIRWRTEQAALEEQWAHYRDRPKSKLATHLGRALFVSKIRRNKEARTKAWRVREVEKAVTGKHARAWRELLASSDQELLVLEADAVLTDSTAAVLEALIEHHVDQPRYVNLAAGLDLRSLGIDHLALGPSQEHHQLTRFSKAVTNTSCAYLINRPMATLAVEHLAAEPQHEELGIDWLVNAIFLANPNAEIQCLMAQPPAIIHGSVSGITKSWHPGR